MAENGKETMTLNATDYEIGYNNNGEVMIVTIPLRAWSKDKNYGDVKVSGVFTKAERIALKNLQVMRSEEAGKGLMPPPPGIIPMPNGRPN